METPQRGVSISHGVRSDEGKLVLQTTDFVQILIEGESLKLHRELVTIAAIHTTFQPRQAGDLMVLEPRGPHDLDFHINLAHLSPGARSGPIPDYPHCCFRTLRTPGVSVRNS